MRAKTVSGPSLAYEGQTVSGRAPYLAIQTWKCPGPGPTSGYPGVAVTRLQGAAEWCYHSSQVGTPRKGDQPKDWRAPTQEPAPLSQVPPAVVLLIFDLHGAFSEVAGTPATSSMCCPRLGSNGVKKVEVIGTLWWVTSRWLSCLYSPCGVFRCLLFIGCVFFILVSLCMSLWWLSCLSSPCFETTVNSDFVFSIDCMICNWAWPCFPPGILRWVRFSLRAGRLRTFTWFLLLV